MSASLRFALLGDRGDQRVAGLWRRIERREHAGQDVEIARAPDLAPRRVDRGERRLGRRADEIGEQAGERRRAFQRLAQVVDARRFVLAGARELARSEPQRARQRGAAVRRPARFSTGGHDDAATRARARKANFCTLPVEVLGISANTTRRGHL